MSMKKMLAVVAAASLVAVAAPAFAANPFSDVPMNHWAYDAIEQLAAKGILEGYPNGTYRGGRTMTRYEIACMVARLMNAGLTGEELERLKALVVEFQPELEALGVKVDDLDARVSSLEKGLKGWQIHAEMRFDYNAYDNHDNGTIKNTGADGNGFSSNRARLTLHKDLDHGLQFDMRLHAGRIDRYWLTANDFLGVDGLTAKLGSFAIDWMAEDGVVGDIDSWFMDITYRGALIKYAKGPFEIQAFYASDKENETLGGNNGPASGTYASNSDAEDYGARIKFNFNENLWLSVNATWVDEPTDEVAGEYSYNPSTGKMEQGDSKLRLASALGKYGVYWASLGFKFMPGLELKGSYFIEDLEDPVHGILYKNGNEKIDDPNAYQIILSAKQDLLKFTSVWLEYAHFDQGFFLEVNPWSFYDGNTAPDGGKTIKNGGTYAKTNFPGDFKHYCLKDDVDVFFVKLRQQWNAKFASEERYVCYDQDGTGNGDASEWSVELFYQYTPELCFSLGYADMDGRFVSGSVDEDYENKLVRFRTYFNF